MKNQKLLFISTCFIAIGILHSCASSKNSSMNNMVARMQVDTPIPGVCDNNNVIAILPISGNGQVKAVGPKTDAEITLELNAKVTYLKDKPSYVDKGMVSIIINCKGEMVQCKIDNKTQSPELDSQIVAVFAEMKVWTPGKMYDKPIDTVELYSFTIKDGKIILN